MRWTVFLLIFLSYFATGQTIIDGIARSYKNKTLGLYRFSDRITMKPILLTQDTVDSTGRFEFKFNVKDTQQVFLDLETVRGFIYVAPNAEYRVLLPKYKPITLEQQLSPFFKPDFVRLWVLNQDTNSLNYVIAKLDKQFNNLLLVAPKVSADSIAHLIERFAAQRFDSRYLNQYLFYRTGLLLLATEQIKRTAAIDSFFAQRPILWHNPAYFALFNVVFDDFLNPQKGYVPAYKIIVPIKRRDFQALTDTLGRLFPKLDTNLRILIILRGLHDLYYDSRNWEPLVINVLRDGFDKITDSTLLSIAHNIYEKITRMRVGYPPPEFNLPNQAGIRKTLKSFRGKFVYLNFCHPKSIACQQQLDILAKYMESAPKDFTVVTIMYGMDKKQLRRFLKKHGYKWTFLLGDYDRGLLKKYDVVAFPTYYLISPEGKLLLNPTPSPVENFEVMFSRIYKNWYKRHERTRDRESVLPGSKR